MKIPGIVIAASASGSGKTAVTMAMMKALEILEEKGLLEETMRTGLY